MGVVHFWPLLGNNRARRSGRVRWASGSIFGPVLPRRRSASPTQARWVCSGPRSSRVSQCGWRLPVINSRGLLPTRSVNWLRM